MKDLRAEYVETGAIRPIPEEAASHVSCTFLVTKPTEDGVRKFRLVIDLRKVNTHLRKMGLRYERLRDFGHLLWRDDWMVGFDIKNADHHLRIRDACATAFFTVSLRRGIVSVCGPTLWALFESILFYASDAGGRPVPPGTPPILQDDSPLPLWMFRGGHQFVGLLLAVRNWDPGKHFGLLR